MQDKYGRKIQFEVSGGRDVYAVFDLNNPLLETFRIDFPIGTAESKAMDSIEAMMPEGYQPLGQEG